MMLKNQYVRVHGESSRILAPYGGGQYWYDFRLPGLFLELSSGRENSILYHS